MNIAAPIPEISDAEPSDETPDVWAGRQVAMLRELAEIGMKMARLVHRQAEAAVEAMEAGEAAQAGVGLRGDPGLVFARVARAVRQTLVLETQVREGLTVQRAKVAAEQAERQAQKDWFEALNVPGYDLRRWERINRTLDRVVDQIIDDETTDPEYAEDLKADFRERYYDDDHYGDVLDRPIGETIARICRDLDIEPAWADWAH
jgi:hypothetical protein